MIQLKALWSLYQYLSARVRRDERGDALAWVMLAAIGVVIALAVGLIIYNLATDKANNISTDFNP